LTTARAAGPQVSLLGQARILQSVAADGLLPAALAARAGGGGAPRAATWLSGAACAAVAWAVPLRELGEMVSVGTLVAFAAVCAAVIALREAQPDRPRPFRAPLYPAVPAAGFLVATMQVRPAEGRAKRDGVRGWCWRWRWRRRRRRRRRRRLCGAEKEGREGSEMRSVMMYSRAGEALSGA
jgi:hypothetical protein